MDLKSESGEKHFAATPAPISLKLQLMEPTRVNSTPELQTVYAFCDGNTGGNAAGVLIADTLPDDAAMQRIAAELGHSETVFAAPRNGDWRVRYFAPAMEVPFCGHATIALAAAFASKFGDGTFRLTLNEGAITVEGAADSAGLLASLHSPRTSSEVAGDALLDDALALLQYSRADLDPRIPAAVIRAGATHLVLGLRSRQALRDMHYDFETGRALMEAAGLITILLAVAETDQLFHTRNPFAAGGVYEDPATGAATAAFAGYLRDLHWPHGGRIDVIQGEDMGSRSLLHAGIPVDPGAGIRVSGRARIAASQRISLTSVPHILSTSDA